MSDQDLPEGAFLTTLNGRQCTAVPRSDAAATSTAVASSTAAATSADATVSPLVAAGGVNDDDGSVSAATAADAAATADVGVQADTGAAESTANSSPGVDPAFEAASSSPAQPQDGEAIGQTAVQAQDISSPSEPPPSSPPTQASIQDGQEPLPSSPAEPPEISQTLEQSQATPERSPTDNSAAPTTPPVNVNNAGDEPEEPVPTPVPPQDNTTPDATTSTPGLDGAAAEDTQEISDGSGGNTPSTAVLAGSIAGGVALVSVIAFLLWFWRKRAINKRRSSLLTPLTIPPGAGKGGAAAEKEKGAYVIDRESLGPTPEAQRFRAAVGAGLRRFGGGKSQSAARDDASSVASREVVTGRDRFRDWWERLTADVNFNWKLRNDGAGDPDPAAAARDVRERGAGRNGSQPDFLTLLGMDDGEVQREAARRQGHKKGGSSASDHFLGGLGLNFDSSSGGKENPFSDMNALSHDSAKPAPLSVSPSRTANPFSDDNAARGPATYVADVRRSRGHPGGKEPFRESVASEEPRRTKFRSDPFDLERPELLGSRQDLTMTSAGGEEVGRPRRAHTREDSFTSKYSSGFSLGDWSDPGPDVGPGGTNLDGGKKGGNGTVGKAL